MKECIQIQYKPPRSKQNSEVKLWQAFTTQTVVMENDILYRMSKFKSLLQKLQHLLEERSYQFELLRSTCTNYTEFLTKVTDSEAIRRVLISDITSSLYSVLNREYCLNSMPVVVSAVEELASSVFKNAMPRFRIVPISKPKLVCLYGFFKRFFVETFNINALTIIEKLQTSTFYSQIFGMHLLVKQAVEISHQAHLVRLKRLTEQDFEYRPPTRNIESQLVEAKLYTKVPTLKGVMTTAVNSPERSPLSKTQRATSLKSQGSQATKEYLQTKNSITTRFPKPELVLRSLQKQITPNKPNTTRIHSVLTKPLIKRIARIPVKTVEEDQQNQKDLQGRSEFPLRKQLKPQQQTQKAYGQSKKVAVLNSIYDILEVDRKTLKELANMDEKYYKKHSKRHSLGKIVSKVSLLQSPRFQ